VSKSYKKFFDDYKEKMFLILTTKWPWYQPSEQAVCFFLPDLLKIHLHNLFFTLLKILWYHKNCDIWYHTVLTELKTAFNCGKNFI
jgi:hypothetical protein